MLTGRVEFFNNAKGWGIIKTVNDGSFFVHHTAIKDKRFFPPGKMTKFRTLKAGHQVSFSPLPPIDIEVQEAEKARMRQATEVHIIDVS